MVFTSVVGHLMELDFGSEYRGWSRCSPEALFEAPVHKTVSQVRIDAYVIGELNCSPVQSKKPIERNLAQLARSCQWLVLWLDCDREGENIAFEVRVRPLQRCGTSMAALCDRFAMSAVRAIHNWSSKGHNSRH